MPLPNTFAAASARGYGAFGQIASAVDPNFSSVSLLLPGNGTNGAQNNTFLDSSTNNFTITRNGNTTQGSFSPFAPASGSAWSAATNGGSGYFDGSGDYLGVADSTAFDLNTTFTVEGWFYQPTAGNGTIFARGGGAASWSTVDGYQFNLMVFSGLLYWQFNTSGSATSLTTTAPAAGAWHHVAVGYNGTTTRVWLNGTSVATSANGYTLPSTRSITRVGLSPVATEIFTGYISNLRVVKGTDVYGVGNTSITVPTAPLTAITNTSFLLNFTNGAIYDAAAKNDLETVGNAQISTTQSKWGGSSMYFDGTGDNLVSAAPSTVPFAFGTGDFTIECWAYFSALSAANMIYDGRPLATNTTQPTIYANNVGNLFYFANNANQIQAGASAVTTATWYHIAVARSGTSTKMFLNGTQVGSTYSDSTNYTNTSGRPIIGVDGNSGNTNYLNGYIQDIRITKGVARYASNFTPPTAPFPVR